MISRKANLIRVKQIRKQNLLRASAVLVFSAWALGTPSVSGQSRAEEWERQRIEKASALTAPNRGGLESGIYQFEDRRILERFENGFAGFHPKLGGMSTGSGFALGTEFRNDALAAENLLIRIAGQGSFSGYQLYETQFGLPRLADGRLFLDFTARYRNYPQEDFSGIGPDSQVSDRTNYRLEDTDLVGTIGARTNDWLSLGFRGGLLRTNTGTGTDARFPATESRFDDILAPALQDQPNYLYAGPYLEIDYRDSKFNPRAGGYYHAEWTSFDDRKLGQFGFNRFEGEIRQYIPFFNRRRVIAFRAKTSMVGADAGQRVPFFLQPTLGGSEDLRGFREFRFQDRNMMVMNLEYRWEAFSGLDMAVFGDAGKVFNRRADLDLSDLEASWGFGARFNSANGVFLRIDTGFSHEGHRIFYKFGHSF